MFLNDNSGRIVRLSLIAGGMITVSLTLSTPALAQTQQDDSMAEEPTTIVVTGSRIRRIQQEGPSPVVTITAEDMNNRGYNTVLEALNDLSQNAGGGIDQQNSFGLAPSASAVDLRGFGIGRSLVLVDGRRVPVFPLADGGTTNFVDLSSIPAVAIERIEVLTDGASAIYGSDAIGGVVNIILKKSTEDELALRRSDTIEGGGAQTRMQFAKGVQGRDGSNALFFLEYYQQDALRYTDRDYSRSDRLGGIDGVGPGAFSSYGNPGTFYDPFGGTVAPAVNCTASGGGPGTVDEVCLFNRAAFRQLLPEMQRYSLTAKYDRPLTEAVTLFGKLSYLNSTTKSQSEPMALDIADDLGILLTADAPNNPTNPAVDTAGAYPDNFGGDFLRRLVEFGPRRSKTDNDTFSALFGLRGTFSNGYEWESGAGYSKQQLDVVNSGYARNDALAAAICGPDGVLPDGFSCDSGTLNLFEPIPQSVVDQLSIRPHSEASSSVASLDFTLSGSLFSMRHGPAKFALVTEFDQQRFEDRRDPDVLAGNVLSLGGTAGGGERKYYAAGVEVELPVLEKLAVNLAGRFDQYDDDSNVGGAFSPRLALQYKPTPGLLLRTTAGKSFRAPDLQRLFGAEVSGFTELIDTPTCVALGGQKNVPLPGLPVGAFDPCVEVVQSVQAREGANRNLKEESGENYSAGIVWEALHGLTLSMDFFYSELTDIVNTPDLQIMLDKNAVNGDFADAIVHTPTSSTSINPGGLDLVSAQARNLSLQRTRGVDFSGDYRFDIAAAGTLRFALNGTYLDEIAIRESAGDPLSNVLKDGVLAEDVRLKGNASVNWNRGPVAATMFLNYIGPFAPVIPGNQDTVGSWTTVNVSAAYDLSWNGQLQLGVNNVFNRDPPLYTALGDGSQPFYNRLLHDAYGASWFVNYSQKF